MDVTSLLVFAAAYLAVVILPGPAVTALTAHVLAHGPRGVPCFIAGVVFGALIWFTVAATGLAALAAAFGGLFVAIRYAGAAYLLYLAWRLWTAQSAPRAAADAPPAQRWGLVLTGLAINLGNPKAVVFFLALLPTVVPLEKLSLLGIAELAIVIAIVVTAVFSVYAVAAARARRLFTSPGAVRMLNRGSSVALAGAAAIAAR
jgi:threonine/homoserine/homoserine lactone efflux protein